MTPVQDDFYHGFSHHASLLPVLNVYTENYIGFILFCVCHVASSWDSFVFVAVEHRVLADSSVDGHQGCFQSGAVMNNKAAMTTLIMWVCAFLTEKNSQIALQVSFGAHLSCQQCVVKPVPYFFTNAGLLESSDFYQATWKR